MNLGAWWAGSPLPVVTRLADGPDPCAGAMSNSSTATTTPRYTIQGEGHCVLGLEVLLPVDPAQEQKPKIVLWVSRKGSELAHPRPGALSLVEQQRIITLRQNNCVVVLLDVSTSSRTTQSMHHCTPLATWDD